MHFWVEIPGHIFGMSNTDDGLVFAVGKGANYIESFEMIDFKTNQVKSHAVKIEPELCVTKVDLQFFSDVIKHIFDQ